MWRECLFGYSNGMVVGLLVLVILNFMSDMVELECCFVIIKNGFFFNIRRYVFLVFLVLFLFVGVDVFDSSILMDIKLMLLRF